MLQSIDFVALGGGGGRVSEEGASRFKDRGLMTWRLEFSGVGVNGGGGV